MQHTLFYSPVLLPCRLDASRQETNNNVSRGRKASCRTDVHRDHNGLTVVSHTSAVCHFRAVIDRPSLRCPSPERSARRGASLDTPSR
ncbi:hypothetical protein EYF80_028426 [Liparis tanakae]|uniref:Uncharacterized protein n=1 Tax=Liparis tanakae TaxID=230148 RepID=A0A4Z2H6G1_9TELE|nr:hypothetical protein EYF80_028426 [Liparis tanakae]